MVIQPAAFAPPARRGNRAVLLSNPAKFAIVFVVVNLHLLRNVSFVFYTAIYAIVAIIVYVQLLHALNRGRLNMRWGLLVCLLYAAAHGLMITAATIPLDGAFYGLARFTFVWPVLAALLLYTDSLEDLRAHIKTFCVFFVLASLTLPLQLVTGPIGWFVDHSTRAGFDRYGSLLGSLTSLGVVLGSYLILTHALSPKMQAVFVCVILMASVFSLSKAAIVNSVLALGIFFVLNRKSIGRFLKIAGMLAGAALIAYSALPEVAQRVEGMLVSFGLASDTIVNYDTSIDQSIWDRLFLYPSANFAALTDLAGTLGMLTGGGFGMASTALVPPSGSLAPMTHNGPAELISMFGIFVGGTLIGSLLVIQYRLIKFARRYSDPVWSAVSWSFLLLFANSFFANGTLYQPASACIYVLGLFVAMLGPDFADRTSRDHLPSVRRYRGGW